MPYSSLGRPATALSPMLGMIEPLNVQTSLPSSVRTTLGAWSACLAGRRSWKTSGGSTRWSSTLTRIMSAAFIGAPPLRKIYEP
jgi:hypothetical protein